MTEIFNQNNLRTLLDASMFNPMHSHMLFCKDRMNSFKDWPKQMRQKPEELAKNGLFYSGIGDRVLCFYCDLALRDWNSDDHIAIEHGKWSPQCLFLKMIIDNSLDICHLF